MGVDAKGWKKRYEHFQNSPLLLALFWGFFAAIVVAVNGWQLGKDLATIVLVSLAWGALFAVFGATYPRTRRRIKENMPTRIDRRD